MKRATRLVALGALAVFAARCPLASAKGSGPPVAVGAQLTQDASSAQIVFELSAPVHARVYALASPYRLVVDLPEINFQLDPSVGHADAARGAPLVRAFRFGLLAPGKSRIVIDLVRPACPGQVDAKPIVEGAPASRLKIELKPCDVAAFSTLDPLSAANSASLDAAPSAAPPVVVLDPGHGGIDSGARGIGGVLEKTLVFQFCSELKRQLEATHRYRIVLTRDADQYVDLDDRVEIARRANASLFVSIHADTLRGTADVSGSTVYTDADRASDAEAARIAASENAADRSAGSEKGHDDAGVANILFDLERRETRAYAHIFSRALVDHLRGATKLNHNPERSAGFVVLKAPEFPSVLVELGYLSNPEDVQSMVSPEWRVKAAAAMTKAIEAFFDNSAKSVGAASGGPGIALTGEQRDESGH